MIFPPHYVIIVHIVICKRCGYRVSAQSKRLPRKCPNCERQSWRTPFHLLSALERRGLDEFGRDLNGRRSPCLVESHDADVKLRRKRLAEAELKRLLGQ